MNLVLGFGPPQFEAQIYHLPDMVILASKMGAKAGLIGEVIFVTL